MDLKGQVLATLENNKGQYISGSALATEHYVSRNAVWKAVKALKEEGHEIEAVTNKGYCLKPGSDILSEASIGKFLGDMAGTFSIQVFKTLASTNISLKEQAAQGAPEGTVFVSEEQTGGRGRLGRNFYSPAGIGVYFSLLLRPSVKASDATLITTAAAAAVASSIEAVTGAKVKIKWVNDVFVSGKKVCGILTEGAFDMESGGMEYAVLGIGVNVTKPEEGFPADLTETAGAICVGGEAAHGLRSRLIAEILKRFWEYYVNLTDRPFLNEYKRRSFIVGYDVEVIKGDTSRTARALEIDDDCRLVVRFDDGAIEALSSGEVSIRPKSRPE